LDVSSERLFDTYLRVPLHDGRTETAQSGTMPTPIISQLELSQHAQHWVNVALIWIGFGTVAGLLAKVLLPVRQPSGSVATLLLGITGSVIGLLGLSWLQPGRELNPISPLGFLAATAGAFVLLIGYRLLHACFGNEDTADPGPS